MESSRAPRHRFVIVRINAGARDPRAAVSGQGEGGRRDDGLMAASLDVRRVHLTMKWVVSGPNLSCFG